MSTRGGQPGNKNAGTAADTAPFKSALTRAIKQDNSARIRLAAERLLDKASEGEAWAIGMLADRMDGKPAQIVQGTGEGGKIVHRVEVVIVDPQT